MHFKYIQKYCVNPNNNAYHVLFSVMLQWHCVCGFEAWFNIWWKHLLWVKIFLCLYLVFKYREGRHYYCTAVAIPSGCRARALKSYVFDILGSSDFIGLSEWHFLNFLLFNVVTQQSKHTQYSSRTLKGRLKQSLNA